MGHCERLDRKAFRALLDSKLRSAPQSMRGPKTLPYSRRGEAAKRLPLAEMFFFFFWGGGFLKGTYDYWKFA